MQQSRSQSHTTAPAPNAAMELIETVGMRLLISDEPTAELRIFAMKNAQLDVVRSDRCKQTQSIHANNQLKSNKRGHEVPSKVGCRKHNTDCRIQNTGHQTQNGQHRVDSAEAGLRGQHTRQTQREHVDDRNEERTANQS
jgi:hypothetical protein